MAASILAMAREENGGSPIREPPDDLAIVTAEDLAKGDGSLGDDGPVLVGLLGFVYDVSAGRSFYGPGGPYAMFAGKDATRGLASFNMHPKDKGGDYSDMCERHQNSAKRWQKLFDGKYKVIGRLEKKKSASPQAPTVPKANGKSRGDIYASTAQHDDQTCTSQRRSSYAHLVSASFQSSISQQPAITGNRITRFCEIL